MSESDRPMEPISTKTPRLIYNDDGIGIGHGSADDPVGSLRQWVDRVFDHIRLDVFALSLAATDIVYYPSQVGEVVGDRWDDIEAVPSDHMRNIARRIRALRALEMDPVSVIADRVHEHECEFFAEMRMGDTHHISLDPNEPLVPQFTIDHPEWIIQRRDTLPEGVQETAMDYSIEEVRDHRFAILRELATREEVDGLELNFIRWGKFFVREEAPQKIHLMTDFVGRVRQMLIEVARMRNCDALKLGVRTPSTLAECRQAGLDPQVWVENDWLDYLAVCDFNFSDPQIPIDEFAAFTDDTKCSLLLQMGDMIGGVWRGKPSMKDRQRGLAIHTDSYHGYLNSAAEARATAYNAYAWGADGVAFWNICCNMHDNARWCGPEQRARIMGWLNAVATPESVLAGPRHYHFLPLFKWQETPQRNFAVNEQFCSPLGGRHCQILTFSQEAIGRRQVYTFRMADARDGRPLSGLLRFQIFHIEPGNEVAIDINGVAVAAEVIRCDYRPDADPPTTWFELSLVDSPEFRGFNELGITLNQRDDWSEVPYMEELEVIVERQDQQVNSHVH